MFVTTKKYSRAVEDWAAAVRTAAAYRQEVSRTEQHLRSAESALAYKDDVIEELQAEVYELTKQLSAESNAKEGWWENYRRKVDEYNKFVSDTQEISAAVNAAAKREVAEAEARATAAEKALAAATKISYVVALHERDVPASPRYVSLDTAYGEYMNATKPDVQEKANGIFPHYPYRIFALRGDEVIADVTDPSTWDERLPVSEKRDSATTVPAWFAAMDANRRIGW